MSGASGLWFDIMVSRCGVSLVTSLCGCRGFGFCIVSSWQRGISILGSKKDYPLNYFERGLVKRVEFGLRIYFWVDPLIGYINLKVISPKNIYLLIS